LLCMFAIAMSAACLAQDSAPNSEGAMPAQGATGTRAIDCGTFAAGDSTLDLVSKLCVFALTYRSKLPDFIAQQTTTSNRSGNTVVTAQVTYHKGLEHYSHVAVNGKPVTPKSTTTVNLDLFTSGEFGPLLINLFEVPGAIEFTFKGTDTLQGVPVAMFDFHLPRDRNTFWAVRDSKGVSRKPEFRGHLWIERQTGHLMREEVSPVLDAWQTGIMSLKTSVDYSMTKVRDLGTFLLPVKSESTVCLMGSLGANLGCSTNVTGFRDYQKFVATSRILPAEAAP
jgi:hypothetical protein